MEIEQGSPEWFAARLGKATASNFNAIIARGAKEAFLAGRKNYRAQLVIERMTGKTPDRFSNDAMMWGRDTEALARLMYTLRTGRPVQQVGFIQHPEIMAGASPDGYLPEDGRLEIKCPNTATHIETLKAKEMPPEYKAQVQGQLWITAGEWSDFMSFDPDMPERSQIFIQRIERDEPFIEMLRNEVGEFLLEVDGEIKFLEGYE
jgi:putative phage-type endonuclease